MDVFGGRFFSYFYRITTIVVPNDSKQEIGHLLLKLGILDFWPFRQVGPIHLVTYLQIVDLTVFVIYLPQLWTMEMKNQQVSLKKLIRIHLSNFENFQSIFQHPNLTSLWPISNLWHFLNNTMRQGNTLGHWLPEIIPK